MGFSEHQILLFFLILVRITSMFVTAPVFSSRGIPMMYKIGAAGIMALLFYPMADNATPFLELTLASTVISVLQEMMTGVAIGFTMGLLFAGIQLAGEFISVDMGLSVAQVFDPDAGQQTSVVARLHNIMALLVFLLLDGHHFLIEAIAYSYSVIPVGGFEVTVPAVDLLIRASAEVFVVAIKVAAPAVVALFLTSVAMGIIARTVPQMNIFFVGFPLRIFVGLVFMSFGFSFFVYVFQKLMADFQFHTAQLLRVL